MNYIIQTIFKKLSAEGHYLAYKNSMEELREQTSESNMVIALKDLSTLDAKSGPLLTHVSLMITTIVVVLSFVNLGFVKRGILIIEALTYLIVAICCLICIHASTFEKTNKRFSREDDARPHADSICKNAMVKTYIFSVANTVCFYLTLFLLFSTPGILLW